MLSSGPAKQLGDSKFQCACELLAGISTSLHKECLNVHLSSVAAMTSPLTNSSFKWQGLTALCFHQTFLG